MASGIYQIENQVNGKRYIGSAVNLRRRWQHHLSALRSGRHYNIHLQRAFDKYSESAFAFIILEQIEDIEQLILCEQRYLDMLKPAYNIAPTAGSRLGVQCSTETLTKMSAAQTGERNPNYGKHPSEETRAKQSAAQAGEQNSMHGRTGKQCPMYGKHHSTETRAKISAAQAGKRNHNYGKHPSNYGKHPSAETLAKMRAANIGKHHSEETKRKMSIAQRARRRRERELKEK